MSPGGTTGNLFKTKATLPLSVVVVVAAGIGMLLWMLCSGKIADDYPYSHIVQGVESFADAEEPLRRAATAFWNCEGDNISSLTDVVISVKNHYFLINGRLANMIALASNLLPPWIIDIAHAAAYLLMLISLLRIIDSEWKHRPLLTLCVVSTFWIVLPWEDYLASSDFMINYVWSSALVLFFIERRIRKPWTENVATMCVFGFVSAMMHEGFSIPFCVGQLLLLWRDFNSEKPLRIAIIHSLLPSICFALGTIVAIGSPAVWLLLEERQRQGLAYNFYSYTLGVRMWPMYLWALLALWSATRRKRPGIAFYTTNLLWAIIGISSCLLSIASAQGGRALWAAYLSFGIASWQILSVTFDLRKRLPASVLRLTTILGLTLLLFWQITLARYQWRFSCEQQNVANELATQRNELVYADVSHQGDMPWWLFEIPQYIDNPGETSRVNLFADIMKRQEPRLVILPSRYKGKIFELLPDIEGNAGLRGVFPVFYSPRQLNARQILLHFGNPSVHKPTGSVNPVYALQHTIKNLKNESSDSINVVCRLSETAIANGCDTAWFYRAIYTGRSLSGLRLLSIDTIP